MSEEEKQRREREMKATLEQIRSFQQSNNSGLSRWYLDVPPWKLAIEGLFVFLIAFLVGLGFAVLYRTIFES